MTMALDIAAPDSVTAPTAGARLLAPVKERAASFASTSPPALRLESIALSFGGVVALADVDLTASSREILAIIGPNGAGKSSLLNVMSGVYRPDSGRIWIGEENFAAAPIDRLAAL